MRIYIKSAFTIALLIAVVPATFSQSLPPAVSDRIDSLFQQWDRTSTPGYTVGIVRNDSLIFAKGYGMANLEYGVPNSPATIYHMASVSKQFTAFSIVLLARQGKLNLDDDIHKYLAWFPDLKEKITIRNLLNHTSGVRDQWQLLAIAGTRLDDVITQQQIVQVLSKQQGLNFKPGERYMYSNSGFTMLAEIVRSVTGQTLRQFTDSAIFRPLGMTRTHFHDDATEIVPNRSYSYDVDDKGHYSNSILSYSNAGATSLFTNVEDMSKWVMNFWDHKVGDQQDVAQLTTRGVLNSGRAISYALGIAVDSFHNQRRYQHSGGDAGYRTFVSVFPDLKMGFIVFSNLGDANPGEKADDLASLFIPGRPSQKEQHKQPPRDSGIAILADPAKWMPFTGFYTSDDFARFQFRIEDRKLYWLTPGGHDLLVPRSGDTAEEFDDPTVWFTFSTAAGGGASAAGGATAEEYWPGNHRHLWRYDTAKSETQLESYTGTYYCPELDCNYRVTLKDHHLFIASAKYNETPLMLFGDDNLGVDWWWMSGLKVVRDARKKITGFEVNSGRIRRLWFKKTDS
ncbi:MAG TPA: serine hydrolase domain-containing protein [Puia sp.]|nr:serine hydrolase domain-containing protein [Puia sp.]